MKTVFSKLTALPAIAVTVAALSCGSHVYAEAAAESNAAEAKAAEKPESAARTLEQLLQFVEQGKVREGRENKAREARFLSEKKNQGKLLDKAVDTRSAEERRSTRLEKIFEQNKEKIAIKRAALNEAKGSLNELFGHINSAAGDMREGFNTSLVSAQYPNRDVFLTELIEKLKGDSLPTIAEIERVWFELQREMIESGRIVGFNADVATPAGDVVQTDVVRVGSFNVVTTDGQYVKNSAGDLAVLARQPSGQFTGWAEDLAASSEGYQRFGIDPTGPSGGSLLAAFINSPTLQERWHQGGTIGYIITAVGVFALLIALWRLVVLTGVSGKVNAQLQSGSASDDNPLGRVLSVSQKNPNMDTETLELKLNEAVLKEIPELENSLTLLKIIAAVAPLLGLLGTVTGMIITFQAITIFGAGDPKAMAGGISGALVTTVLGLIVAIPTLLLHTVVSGRAKQVIHVLEEQAAGIIARNTEAK